MSDRNNFPNKIVQKFTANHRMTKMKLDLIPYRIILKMSAYIFFEDEEDTDERDDTKEDVEVEENETDKELVKSFVIY